MKKIYGSFKLHEDYARGEEREREKLAFWNILPNPLESENRAKGRHLLIIDLNKNTKDL